LCEAAERPLISVDHKLMRHLESHEWPGNVRQLKNTLESMVVLAGGEKLTMEDLPSTLDSVGNGNSDMDIPIGTTLEELEHAAVEQALADCGGNRTRAARSLGISVRTLQRKLKAWGVGSEERVERRE
jgi:DNA-binding NtrC family response regulator